VLVIVFGRVGLDALRQRLEMLAHGVGNLLLQVMVFGASRGMDDGGLVQVEQYVLVHHVLLSFHALNLLEGFLCLVEQKHIGDLETRISNRPLDCVEYSPI
jgi:hypothetical protein